MKRKKVIRFLFSLLQTVLFSLLLALVYETMMPNQKLIIGTIAIFIIPIYFILVMIQNMVAELAKEKTVFWLVSVLTAALTSLLIFNPSKIGFSLLFCLLNLLILFFPLSVKRNSDLDL